MTRTLYVSLCCLSLLFASTSYGQTTGKAADLLRKFESGQYEISHYNNACYFALAGERDMAFKCLEKAIGEGYSDFKGMPKDEDLLSLHSDSRWAGIMKSVQDNAIGKQQQAGQYYSKKSFWESGVFETPYQPNISEEEKIAGLSKFWAEVRYNFVNFDLIPDVNFDSLYLAWIPKVRQTVSTLAYYRQLMELGALLRDGHTNVYIPSELTDSVYARPLLRTRLIEDKVLVVGIYDPALQQQGIAVGQEVVKVNGLPVKEYAARYVTPLQSASTPQDKDVRSFDYALLGGALHEPIQLELADAAGKLKSFTIARVKPAVRSAKLQVPAFEFKMLKGDIAYVALNAFGNDSAAIGFAAKYREISKARAIIFDVRNNGGGNSGVGWNILTYLIDKPAEIHHSYTRDYKPTYRAWGRNQPVDMNRDWLGPNGKTPYTKPVIVLTSARTFSAAEDFAAAFQTMKRGRIMGEATGGSSGQPLMINLPGHGTARICTKRDLLGNDDEFVGKGIIPDKVVKPTAADVREGIDTELQAAITELIK